MNAYVRDIPKTQMKHYAAQWDGLPLPRLQLRWHYKPVPKSEPQRRKDIALSKRMSAEMGVKYTEDEAWDCFYELVLPVDKYDIRNERYGVNFILIPISWARRTSTSTPCEWDATDDTFRDGAHAFWDSKALGWLPIFVVAPNGSAAMKATYIDQPDSWPALAQAIETRRAETERLGAQHESAVAGSHAPDPYEGNCVSGGMIYWPDPEGHAPNEPLPDTPEHPSHSNQDNTHG